MMGQKIHAGQKLMLILGEAKTILSVERTLLNVLSRMSGVAPVHAICAETRQGRAEDESCMHSKDGARLDVF
jgi:nicotinate-nucleotide pyrophosphorylase